MMSESGLLGTRPARFCICAFLLFCLPALSAAGDEAYRRYIVPANMSIPGKGYRIERTTWINCRFTDDEAARKGGFLTKKLERKMPPGKYLVFLSVLPYNPKRAEVTFEIQLGDASTMVTAKPKRKQARFAAVLDVRREWQELKIGLRTGGPNVRIYTVYVSNRPSDLSYDRAERSHKIQEDLIRRESARGTTAPTETPEPENRLPDGSFETGMPTYNWSTRYACGYTITPGNLDSTQAADGKRSLRMKLFNMPFAEDDRPSSLSLMHRVIKLEPQKTYYFRGMFKADSPVSLSVSAETAYGKSLRAGAVRRKIGTTLTPVTMQMETPDDPLGYHLRINAKADRAATLWIDSLSISEKKLDAFVAAAPVEIGVEWQAPGKVFHLGSPVKFVLAARNCKQAGAASVKARYRVVDYFDRTVLKGTTDGWKVPAGKTERRVLDLSTGRTGVFRLLLDGEARLPSGTTRLPLQEYVFTIVPQPAAKMHNTFGAYISLAPEPIEIMSRAGIRRTVTLSCGNTLLEEWRRIEPEPGKFVWWDEAISLARKHDVNIIANLHRDYPKWALDPKNTDDVLKSKSLRISRKAWENFIEKTVAHYKDYIRDWLIIDEPYYSFTAAEYAELLKSTYRAAKRADPDCRVIAHGGYYDPWLPGLEKAGAVPFFDGISDYARTKHQGNRLKKFRDKHNKFIINGEYGIHLSMYRTIEAPNNPRDRRTPAVYTLNTESVAAGALRAMCWSGSVGFNRYDARFPGGDFTKIDRHKCMFEYDGALTPAAAAYAITANLLDGFRGVEQQDINPRLQALLLEDPERFALVLTALDGEVFETALSLPPGVKARNIMGNPLPQAPQTAFLSRAVTYLIGPKSRLRDTQKMVKALDLHPLAVIEAETVLDGRPEQYVLNVKITNKSEARVINALVDLSPKSNIVRDFWQAPVVSGDIKPGGSVKLKFGLNAYKGEKPVSQPCDVTVTFRGITAHKAISNVFRIGRHSSDKTDKN